MEKQRNNKHLIGYFITIPFGIMTIIMGVNMYLEEEIVNKATGYPPPSCVNIVIGILLCITAQIIGKLIEIRIKEDNNS